MGRTGRLRSERDRRKVTECRGETVWIPTWDSQGLTGIRLCASVRPPLSKGTHTPSGMHRKDGTHTILLKASTKGRKYLSMQKGVMTGRSEGVDFPASMSRAEVFQHHPEASMRH